MMSEGSCQPDVIPHYAFQTPKTLNLMRVLIAFKRWGSNVEAHSVNLFVVCCKNDAVFSNTDRLRGTEKQSFCCTCIFTRGKLPTKCMKAHLLERRDPMESHCRPRYSCTQNHDWPSAPCCYCQSQPWACRYGSCCCKPEDLHHHSGS